ncbi:MAG TPA: WYL domain-containing protein [Gaiellaceae bacterium]|nr:WYL domain-containing protein [Gaiellaceae bacterium]
MSHDTDKLIRQLSLVAFLMAERRPLTARDVKGNVEGYSEMSDEAFARRFYSDRAELRELGVPLQSQRDEFTGEELYTLRSERYFLPALELTDDELAALQTCFYLLEGKFAYAEPLRLALQNLALGRPGLLDEAPSGTALRVEMRDPDYSPEMPGRLAKLETAISKQRTVKFAYRAMTSGRETERTLNPYGLLHDRGVWYVVGADLDREAIRTFRVSRIRGDIRFATRRERDFRVPADFDIDGFRGRAAWQFGEPVGEARIEVRPETAWWVERAFGPSGRLEDGVFVTDYSSLPLLASWILRQDGRAAPVSPPDLRREVADSLRHVRERHEGPPSKPAREVPAREPETVGERSSGPVTPERFGLLQALLAYLLAACGDERDAVIRAADIVERFQIPYEELEEHLSLLNLVNFGGGCYAVYAELHGDEVHVDKELFGDTFRSAPRLTPLEARAIRLALEFVGPLIAAEAHRPLDRVRMKLEETFGEFELSQTPEPRTGEAEEALVGTLTDAIRRRRLVEIEYLKEEEGTPTTHLVEPYTIERRLPHWYVHTWDRTRDDERSFRLDRMRSATLTDEEFEPRQGFEPGVLSGALVARVLYSPAVARWEVERGARPLADGSAINEQKIGSPEWLVGEILRYRGEAELLEPPELRREIAKRARSLAQELGVTRLRAPAQA